MMDQRTFEREMMRAKTMAEVGDRPDYWRGYQRGLRKHYHGDNFGTDDEHKKWLSLIGDRDETRNQRGLGYRKGYYYGT